MRLPRHAHRVKRILYAPITIIVLAIVFVFLARAVFNSYRSEVRNRETLETIQAETDELANREAFLTNEIDRLQTDRGMEEALRNKFPVVKEGEHMVIIVEPDEDVAPSRSSETKGFWNKLRDLFR